MLETNDRQERLDVEDAVRRRYSQGARSPEASLCCAVTYDTALLEAIPEEVVERDYGCGDPTRHVRRGETVLDLGCGAGKACFIAAQVVGAEGRVIGVDMNDDMLAVARRAAPVVAQHVGFANVELRKGKIQDLRLDRDLLDSWLREHPVRCEADLISLESETARLRETRPLVPDGSVDVVVSNCVLNLVRSEDKRTLFDEIFRVLKRGGRALISDIVSDEDVPERLQRDPELWSGCVSGALREDLFLRAFEDAGFHGMTVLERQREPWRTIEGIELRSVTVAAWKGKQGECWDQKHAVVYRGPFRRVEDDDDHVFERGVRMAVCEKTFRLLSQEPYRSHVDLVEPREVVPLEMARPFPCDARGLVRSPRETKGDGYAETTSGSSSCSTGGGSCCGA
jgi:SAM-dependent methyltransferase